MYLDHRRTNLARHYGIQGGPLKAYEEARAEAAANPAFTFIWELRNFVQHCGMPLQVLRDRQRLVPDDASERVEVEMLVGCRCWKASSPP